MAFLFGHVISRRPDTPPDNLVLRIIQAKSSPHMLPNMASTMRRLSGFLTKFDGKK